jgi:hypothetical protein
MQLPPPPREHCAKTIIETDGLYCTLGLLPDILFVFLTETMKLLKMVMKRYITVHSEYKKLHNTIPVFLLKASIHMKEEI